jgi:hypothetical protein
MTALITVNKNHTCNVAFINAIGKFIIGKVFIRIIIVSLKKIEKKPFLTCVG